MSKNNDPTVRTEDFDVNYYDKHPVLYRLTGGGLNSFEFNLNTESSSSDFGTEKEVEEAVIEFINDWGKGRGVSFDHQDEGPQRGYDKFEDVSCNFYFTPGFKTVEDMDQALGDDGDGVI